MPFNFNDTHDIDLFLKQIHQNIQTYLSDAGNYSKKRVGSFGPTGQDRAKTFEAIFDPNAEKKLAPSTQLFCAYALLKNPKGPTLVEFAKKDLNKDPEHTTNYASTVIMDLYKHLTGSSIDTIDPQKQAEFQKKFGELLKEFYALINSGKILKTYSKELNKTLGRIKRFTLDVQEHQEIIHHYKILERSVADKSGNYAEKITAIPEKLREKVLHFYFQHQRKSFLYALIEAGGSVNEIDALLDIHPSININKGDHFGRPPLFAALHRGDLDLINLLLSKTSAAAPAPDAEKPEVAGNSKINTINVRRCDNDGSTLLHEAAKINNIPILFDSKIDPKILLSWLYRSNTKDQTPLHVAIANANLDSFLGILKYLEQTQPGLNSNAFWEDENHENIIHFLLKTLKNTLKIPANQNPEEKQRTQFIYFKMLSTLLKKTDPHRLTQENNSKQTPLQLAKDLELPENIICTLSSQGVMAAYAQQTSQIFDGLNKNQLGRLKKRLSKALESYRRKSQRETTGSVSEFIKDMDFKISLNTIVTDLEPSLSDTFSTMALQRIHQMFESQVKNLFSRYYKELTEFQKSLKPMQHDSSHIENFSPHLIRNLLDLNIEFEFNIYDKYPLSVMNALKQYRCNIENSIKKNSINTENLAHWLTKELQHKDKHPTLCPRILLLAWLVPSLFFQPDEKGTTPLQIAKKFGCNLEKLISLMNIAKENTQELMTQIEQTIVLSPSGHIKALTQESLFNAVNNNEDSDKESEETHLELAIKEQNKQHQTYKQLFKVIRKVISDEELSWHTGVGGTKITVTDSKGHTFRKKVSDHGETIWQNVQAGEKLDDLDCYKRAWQNITSNLPKETSKNAEEAPAHPEPEKSSMKKKMQEFFGQRSDSTKKFYNTLAKFHDAPTREEEDVIANLENELRAAFR